MSNETQSSTTSAPRETASGTPSSAFAAKMARFTTPPTTPSPMPSPAAAGAAKAQSVEATPEIEEEETTGAVPVAATKSPVSERPRREGREAASTRPSTTTRHFKIDPGVANVTVTSRVPKNLHAKLKIHVLTQQLATAGSDACMNAFIIDAIAEKLSRDEAA